MDKFFDISKKQLMSILERLRPALGLELLRESDTIIFIDDRICTVNEEMYISFPFECGGFEGGIPAHEFIQLISKMPEKITMTIKPNEVVVKGGGTSFGLIIKPDVDSYLGLRPDVVKYNSKKWNTIPEGLIDALAFCSFSCATAIGGMGVEGVCVDGANVLSSDGYRMTWYLLEDRCEEKFAIPRVPASELIKYELSKYYVEDNWIHLIAKGSRGVISVRLLDATFPVNPKSAFPSSKDEKKMSKIELPEELIDTLSRVNALLRDYHVLDRGVTLGFAKKKLTCYAESQEKGWIKEPLKLSENVDTMEIRINPELLCAILRYTKTLRIEKGVTRLMFTGENFKHILTVRKKK